MLKKVTINTQVIPAYGINTPGMKNFKYVNTGKSTIKNSVNKSNNKYVSNPSRGINTPGMKNFKYVNTGKSTIKIVLIKVKINT